jgi:ABC-type transport system involved in multi-copper enzyme maturation permease subunit
MKQVLYLLQLEWLKVRKYRQFQVLLAFYGLTLPLFTFVIEHMPLPSFVSNPLMFPNVWQNLGYLSNWLTFFVVGFLSVTMITNEFSSRTLRQNIINGLPRRDFFLSKVLFLVLLCLGITIYYWLIATLMGCLHTENIYFDRFTEGFWWAGRLFLLTLLYASFGFLLGVVIRRSGVALFLFFTWAMFLERILRYALHYKIAKNETMHYYPINASGDLMPMPVPKMAEGFLNENGFNLLLQPQTAIIVTSIYVILFLFISYRLLMTRDL